MITLGSSHQTAAWRLGWLRSLSADDRRLHELCLRRLRTARRLMGGKKRSENERSNRRHGMWPRQLWVAYRDLLTDARRTFGKIERALKTAVQPWHLAGHRTKDSWMASGDPNAQAYQSVIWRKAYIVWKKRQRDIPGTWTFWQWLDKIREFGSACAYCGCSRAEALASGHDLEADHLFGLGLPDRRPDLSRYVSNHIANVVPACKACNSSKCDSYVIDWLRVTGRIATCHPLVMTYHDATISGGAARTNISALAA